MNETKLIHKGPGGIRLELDASQIFPDDPGQGTPALVIMPNGDTGTFSCVNDQGETVDGTRLSAAQQIWLARMTDAVDEFMRLHSGKPRGHDWRSDGRCSIVAGSECSPYVIADFMGPDRAKDLRLLLLAPRMAEVIDGLLRCGTGGAQAVEARKAAESILRSLNAP